MKSALLQALDEAGVTLWWDGEALRYRAPCEAITPVLREAMAEARGDLIVAVEARGGVILPGEREHWPEDLRAEFDAQVAKMAEGSKLSSGDIERRAQARASAVWLQWRMGGAGSP